MEMSFDPDTSKQAPEVIFDRKTIFSTILL